MSRPLTPYEVAEMARKYGIPQGDYRTTEAAVIAASQASAQQKAEETAPQATKVIEQRVATGETSLTAAQQYVLASFERQGLPVPDAILKAYGLPVPSPAPTPYQVAEIAQKEGISVQGKDYATVEQEVIKASQQSAEVLKQETAPQAIQVIDTRVQSGQTSPQAAITFYSVQEPTYVDPLVKRAAIQAAINAATMVITPYEVAEQAKAVSIPVEDKTFVQVQQEVTLASQESALKKSNETASKAMDVIEKRIETGETSPQVAISFLSEQAPIYSDAAVEAKALKTISAIESGQISRDPSKGEPQSITQAIFQFDPFQAGQEFALNLFGVKDETKRQTLMEANMLKDVIPMATRYTPFEEPIKTVAGFVGSVESLWNPNVPSLSGALASDVISGVSGKEVGAISSLEEKWGRSYITGSLLGEALLFKGVSGAGAKVGLSAKALGAGAALNVGISQGISYALTGQLIGGPETRQLAYAGAGEAILGAAALGMIAKSGKTGVKVASNIFGRAGVNAAIDAGIEGVASKGDLQRIASGAAFGAVFSVGGDIVSMGISELRAKLPKSLGGVERLELGEITTGKSGQEIDTFVSKEGIEELGGKRVRVIPDVSEKVVGVEGVTTESLIGEYTGKRTATAHATLSTESFDIDVGGKTLLEGIPSESAGFRKAKELYPFYSAPSGPEDVTIYGGYAGIGEGISDQPAKIRFGGKATALVTLDTEISPSFLRQTGESVDDYLTRVTRLAGETGIAPETVLGKSVERQVVTTTAYERGGEQLVGTQFVSEGKIGTFQIKQKGEGLLSLPKYTNVDIVLGKFEVPDIDIPTTKINLTSYGESYGKTMISSAPTLVALPQISTPKISTSTTKTKQPSTLQTVNKKLEDINESLSSSSIQNVPSIISSEKIESSPIISEPSVKPVSQYKFPSSLPSEYTKSLSTMSLPSLPKISSVLSVPISSISLSLPSPPKISSVPSVPTYKENIPSLPKSSIPNFPSEASIVAYTSPNVQQPKTTSPPSIITSPSVPSFPQESIPSTSSYKESLPSLPKTQSKPSAPTYAPKPTPPTSTSTFSYPSYPSKPSFLKNIFTETKKKPIRKSELSFVDLTKQKLKYPIATPQSVLKGITNPFKVSKTRKRRRR